MLTISLVSNIFKLFSKLASRVSQTWVQCCKLSLVNSSSMCWNQRGTRVLDTQVSFLFFFLQTQLFFLLQTLSLNPNQKQLQTQIKNNPGAKSKSTPMDHNISYPILPFLPYLKHFSFPPPPQRETERKREAALLIVSRRTCRQTFSLSLLEFSSFLCRFWSGWVCWVWFVVCNWDKVVHLLGVELCEFGGAFVEVRSWR